jgi:hypothetical protein
MHTYLGDTEDNLTLYGYLVKIRGGASGKINANFVNFQFIFVVLQHIEGATEILVKTLSTHYYFLILPQN